MPPDTGRLTFREMASGDLGDMAALLGDPEVMTYYPRPKTRQEAAQCSSLTARPSYGRVG
jgi:RimJ/RimL family protein N-acetyltransferase